MSGSKPLSPSYTLTSTFSWSPRLEWEKVNQFPEPESSGQELIPSTSRQTLLLELHLSTRSTLHKLKQSYQMEHSFSSMPLLSLHQSLESWFRRTILSSSIPSTISTIVLETTVRTDDPGQSRSRSHIRCLIYLVGRNPPTLLPYFQNKLGVWGSHLALSWFTLGK